MTNEDAIKWLDNLKNDLGNPHYERLWPYAQALDEIGEMLEEQKQALKREHMRGMTFGQLFTIMNPNVRVRKNGTCIWLYLDDVNYYTIRAEWWDKEIPDNAT